MNRLSMATRLTSLGVLLMLPLAACSERSELDGKVAVYSSKPEILESGYILGRLGSYQGCLVILPGRTAFESGPLPQLNSDTNMDMPIFVGIPLTGHDKDGYFLQTDANMPKLRIGDRVEGTGGVIWSKTRDGSSAAKILDHVTPQRAAPCGNRIIQIRSLKKFGQPAD